MVRSRFRLQAALAFIHHEFTIPETVVYCILVNHDRSRSHVLDDVELDCSILSPNIHDLYFVCCVFYYGFCFCIVISQHYTINGILWHIREMTNEQTCHNIRMRGPQFLGAEAGRTEGSAIRAMTLSSWCGTS